MIELLFGSGSAASVPIVVGVTAAEVVPTMPATTTASVDPPRTPNLLVDHNEARHWLDLLAEAGCSISLVDNEPTIAWSPQQDTPQRRQDWEANVGMIREVLIEGQELETQALVELYEERAAIMEFDGGLPRQEAEQAAWADCFGSSTDEIALPQNAAERSR